MGLNTSRLTCPFTSNIDVDEEQKDVSCCLQKQYHGQELVCGTVLAPNLVNDPTNLTRSEPKKVDEALFTTSTVKLYVIYPCNYQSLNITFRLLKFDRCPNCSVDINESIPIEFTFYTPKHCCASLAWTG